MNANKELTDFTYLLEFSGGDKSFMREMIEIFLEQTPQEIEVLRKSLKKGDFESIGNSAHNLKTSVNLMGAKALKEEVFNLQVYAKTQTQVEKIPDLVHAVTSACTQMMEELKIKVKTI